MQIAVLETYKSEGIDFQRKEKGSHSLFKNTFLKCSNNFVSTCLDSNVNRSPKFITRGFFLESSVDTKIKSVPIFIFSLQRRETMETYISCFYADNYPTLFENFNEMYAKNGCFFFNWFDHKSIVPKCPPHRDAISNVFYYNEGRFLDYRTFDSTVVESAWARKFTSSVYFVNKTSHKKRFVYRNRFYKRKFSWFLREYA